MDKNKKNKLIMLTISTLAILIIVVGVSYAFFRFSLSSANQELVAGQIYMHYKEGQKQINISEAVPSSTYDENEYFEFTIDGKNTSSKDIWYAITLSYGDAPSDRDTKIDDKFLKFTLFEDTSKVVDGASYKNLNNKKLWVNKIDKNTTEDVNITYKLYMWISDKVNIGDDGDYTIDTWNNKVYASVKVNVVGDFTEKTIDKVDGEEFVKLNIIETLKAKAYTDDAELIAIDVTDKSNIKKCESVKACAGKTIEYRFSGPTANNYIKLTDNNEIEEDWRIIGIFTDESGEEYLRVVRALALPNTYLPDTYTINDAIINGENRKVIYTIKYSSYSSSTDSYWNKNDTGMELNRWEESGLQYYLNTDHDDSSEPIKGYLSYLSSDVKDLLQEKKLYLGASHTFNLPEDTPKQAYAHERDVDSCIDGKGPIENSSTSAVESENSGCHVWSGNAATWIGKVGLMYASDYGLSATEDNWTTPLHANAAASFKNTEVNETTWMYNTMKRSYIWFISSSSGASNRVAILYSNGYVVSNPASNYYGGIFPVLNLSGSLTMTYEGDGTSSENAYKVV